MNLRPLLHASPLTLLALASLAAGPATAIFATAPCGEYDPDALVIGQDPFLVGPGGGAWNGLDFAQGDTIAFDVVSHAPGVLFGGTVEWAFYNGETGAKLFGGTTSNGSPDASTFVSPAKKLCFAVFNPSNADALVDFHAYRVL